MLLIETGLVLLSVLIAFMYPSFASRWLCKLEHAFSQLACRRGLSVLLVGLTALALRAAMLPVEPIPEPIVHDEFGYLLAADTFAHGRLTNPTHPMWVHFETFSVLQKPTYQCFAQPAQGIILAFGKVVLGHPFWGVWLSIGLMCAAITWMLQGWLPPGWALLGGALAILRYGTFGYWANSYWGGAPGAIGGALVLGALPRIKQSQRVRDALLMGLGLALLANSRPYEGFVFSLPIAVVLFAWMLGKNKPPLRTSVRRVVLPLLLVLMLTAAGMCYYFWRVTGDPFRMPYQVEQETYAVAPYMLWQHVRPEPIYNNPVIKKMYVNEALRGYQVFRSPVGVLLKIYLAWSFFLGPVLTLPFLMLVLALPRDFSLRDVDSSTVMLLLVLCVLGVGLAVETFYNAHYSAPATGLVLGLILLALRQLRYWNQGGLFLSRAVPVVCVLTFVLRAVATPLHFPLREFYEFAWYEKGPASFGRAAIQDELERRPDKQLVVVHYQQDHEPFAEWVYNDADIDGSRVVWARDMGAAGNRELLRYYANRRVWLIDPDHLPPKALAYNEATAQTEQTR